MATQPPKWLDLLGRPGVSRAMGKLVRWRAPRPVLDRAIDIFSQVYDVDRSEAIVPPGGYRTFQQFFTRALRDGARPVDQDPEVIVSPADGVFSAWGPMEDGTLVQAKGVNYRLDALLGDAADALTFERGTYAVIYLAPSNYHRVHSPVDGRVTAWRHVPGPLYPVNEMGLRHVEGLFARNERIIGFVQSDFGQLAQIMVGATCVGSMQVAFAPPRHLRATTGFTRRINLGEPWVCERGGPWGVFEMGSTVVLLTERDDVAPAVAPGSPIRVGEPLLRRKAAPKKPTRAKKPPSAKKKPSAKKRGGQP